MNLKHCLCKHHNRLTVEQRNDLIKLQELTDLIFSQRYYMGEGLEHNDLSVSEYEYNELGYQEDHNNEIIECIIKLLNYDIYDRIEEVTELLSDEVKVAIKESIELLQPSIITA
ncbi:MAG TPA: hypothetical protein VJY62_02620 [Bacteroidia bacterium]|nr:hypothetical protein [Bacteroidia bacterium]